MFVRATGGLGAKDSQPLRMCKDAERVANLQHFCQEAKLLQNGRQNNCQASACHHVATEPAPTKHPKKQNATNRVATSRHKPPCELVMPW